MIRRFLLVLACFTAVSSSAKAQTKFTGTIECGKLDPEYKVPVVDREGFVFIAGQNKCTLPRPWAIAGLKPVQLTNSGVFEVLGPSFYSRNVGVFTYDNGDKGFWEAKGKRDPKTGELVAKWHFTGGTGKLSGLKGQGTSICPNAGATCNIKGSYTLPKGK